MFPPEAEKKRLEIIRKMSGGTRLKIALDLSNLTHKMMRDGIRNQQPDISPDEFKKQVAIRTQR